MSHGRNLSYFVADVHLGLDVRDPGDRESRFVRFLRNIPTDTTESLYLLGDIWDFWYEYRDVVPKGYLRVFSALQSLMDSGVRVVFVPGNHDIWCYSYFSELGMEVLEQPLVREISGKTFFLGHGDGLGDGMRTYKIMRGTFRWRPFQRMFSCLHPWLAFRLGEGWSRRSRLAREIPYRFGDGDEPLYRYCEKESSESHVDHFIFGHYHTEVSLTLRTGARLNIVPDWMGRSPYLVFDGEELRLFDDGL